MSEFLFTDVHVKKLADAVRPDTRDKMFSAKELQRFKDIRTKTTTMWIGNDYSLYSLLVKLVMNLPASDMKIALPDLDEKTLSAFHSMLTAEWYESATKQHKHRIENLTLIIPVSKKEWYLENKDMLLDGVEGEKGAKRVKVACADFSSTVIYMEKRNMQYSVIGSIGLVEDSSHQNVHTMTISTDSSICRETSDILRVNSHKVI